MTRTAQKNRECRILEGYFEVVGQSFAILETREHPDFIVQVSGRKIAVEVVEYHVPARNAAGFTRRQVEQAWQGIRAYVVRYREGRRELDNLSVRLAFTDLRVPSTTEVAEFVDAVAARIAEARDKVSRKYMDLRIGESDLPILRRYLKLITVRIAGCYMEWDWNHDFGGIGTSEEEMLEVLKRKLNEYAPPPGVSESHLVVAGWGGNLSEIIAPLGAWQFGQYRRLNDALEASAFDAVAVLCLKCLLWRRGMNWLELDHSQEQPQEGGRSP